MTSPVLSKMVGLEKSTNIWKYLCTSYASHTRATIKKLKLLLKTTKNDKFVSKYLLGIKKTVDTFVVVGVAISIEEHIKTILDGLSDEYDGFITSILTKEALTIRSIKFCCHVIIIVILTSIIININIINNIKVINNIHIFNIIYIINFINIIIIQIRHHMKTTASVLYIHKHTNMSL